MILFTDHAKGKLRKEMRKFGITERVVKQVVGKPDEVLFDAFVNRFVAVCWRRNLAVVYEKVNRDFVVITVIYSTGLKEMVDKRRRVGRWM